MNTACQPDHCEPMEGFCFMGLNFTDDQFDDLQRAVNRYMAEHGETLVEEAIAAICREWQWAMVRSEG